MLSGFGVPSSWQAGRNRRRGRSASAGPVAVADAPAVASRTATGDPTTPRSVRLNRYLRRRIPGGATPPADRARRPIREPAREAPPPRRVRHRGPQTAIRRRSSDRRSRRHRRRATGRRAMAPRSRRPQADRSPSAAEMKRARANRSRSTRSPASAFFTAPSGSRRSGSAGRRGLHQTDVGQPVRQRRHADIAAAPDVHLATRRQAVDPFGVHADRPAARPRRMSRQAESEGDSRAPAVGADRHRAAHLAPRSTCRSHPQAGDRWSMPGAVDDRFEDGRVVENSAPAATASRTSAQSKSDRVMARATRPSGYRPSTVAPSSPVRIMPAIGRPHAVGHRRQFETSEDREHARDSACRRTTCGAGIARDRSARRARPRAPARWRPPHRPVRRRR